MNRKATPKPQIPRRPTRARAAAPRVIKFPISDEEVLSQESAALREAGQPEAVQDTVPEAPKKVGVRKTQKRGRAYWRSFRKRLKETDFTENVLRNVVRYKRDKLGRFAK